MTATGSANWSTGLTHGGDRQARGEPHRHLAIAIASREREQHGDEDRDAEEHGKVAQDPEGDEAQHGLGQHVAARRLAEHEDQKPREDEGEQDAHHRDRDEAEFADEAALENHDASIILALWISPSDRQFRQAPQRLHRGGRLRRTQGSRPRRKRSMPPSRGHIAEVLKSGDLEGKVGATLLLHKVPRVGADRVLLVGPGRERELAESQFRAALAAAVARCAARAAPRSPSRSRLP
jgi:hypothetical protein